MIWEALNALEPNVGCQEIAKWVGPHSNASKRSLLLSVLHITCKVFYKSILKNTYTQILKTSGNVFMMCLCACLCLVCWVLQSLE